MHDSPVHAATSHQPVEGRPAAEYVPPQQIYHPIVDFDLVVVPSIPHNTYAVRLEIPRHPFESHDGPAPEVCLAAGLALSSCLLVEPTAGRFRIPAPVQSVQDHVLVARAIPDKSWVQTADTQAQCSTVPAGDRAGSRPAQIPSVD